MPPLHRPTQRSSREGFVGRRDELALIAGAAADAAGGRPWVVAIEGRRGSGKTALIRHAIAELPATTTVIAVEAEELASDIPLWLANELTSLPPAGNPFNAGLELLNWLSDRQDDGPVVVIIDDFQFADVASRQALITMMRRLEHERVLVVVTSHPNTVTADPAWLRLQSDRERCHHVSLGGLAWQEVADLAGTVGVTLSRREAQRLRDHTEGDPLYTVTLLAELPPEQLRRRAGGLPAPRSFAATVAARLAETTSATSDLAAALAVMNQPTMLRTLAAVAAVQDPDQALDELLPTGFVAWHPIDSGVVISFTHQLFRSAIYDDLSPTKRRHLHEQAALHSDRQQALIHRAMATNVHDDALADELVAAADELAGDVGPAAAATLLILAADLTPERPRTEERFLQAARLLLAAGDVAAVDERRERIELCAPGPLRSLVLGLVAWHAGQPATVERHLEPAADAADLSVASEALTRLGIMYVNQSRGADAIVTGDRLLARSDLPSRVRRDGLAIRAVGIAETVGPAAGLAALALIDIDGIDDPAERIPLLSSRGLLSFFAGHAAAARRDLETVLDLSRSANAARPVAADGHVPVGFTLPRVHLQLAQAEFVLGEWDAAATNANIAVDLAINLDHPWELAAAHHAAAVIPAARGQWDAATHHTEAAWLAARSAPTLDADHAARLATAAVARARRDAAAVVDALMPLTDRPIPPLTSLGWWVTLIEAYIELDDITAARTQLARLEVAAADRSIDLPMRIAAIHGRLASVNDDLPAATRHFDAALGAAQSDAPILDRAGVHHEYGRALRRLGRRQAAVDQLRQAHQLLDPLGATPYLQRVEHDLAACGLQAADRRRGRGSLDLTSREHDVAQLVARGLTNREAATQLYVSAKAVEYHLSNIYGKLGINTRQQLRDHVTASTT